MNQRQERLQREIMAQREEMRIRWRLDFSAFVKEALNGNPTNQQIGVLKDLSQPGAKVTVASGHGTGKTTLDAWSALSMLTLYDDVKIPCTAPAESTLLSNLWPEILKWIDRLPPQLRCTLDYRSGIVKRVDRPFCFAEARTARKEKPEALAGIHAPHVLFIIDEAPGVPDPIFEPMEGSLTTGDCRAILTANPTRNSGYFYDTHHKDNRWKRHTLSCVDSPLVNRKYIEEMKAKHGENSNFYRVRVLGLFPLSDSEALIQLTDIEDAFLRDIQPSGDPIIGLDIGRTNDPSAGVVRIGRHIPHMEQWHEPDSMNVIGYVVALANRFNTDKVNIDSIGMGGPVGDRLRQLGFKVSMVNVAEASQSGRYNRLRDELWWKGREFFTSKNCSVSKEINEKLREKFVEELSTIKLLPPTSSGKTQVESKDSLRQRLGASPNIADAFCLTLYDADILGIAATQEQDVPTPEIQPNAGLSGFTC